MRNRNSVRTVHGARLILASAALVGASAATSAFGVSKVQIWTGGDLGASLSQVAGSASSRVSVGTSTGGHGGSDATITYVGPGNGTFSNGANWSPNAPAAADDLVFGPAPAGNYTVTNGTALTYGNVSVNRAAAADTTTLQGGINASTVQVSTGKFVFDGGTSNISGNGATNATISLLAGSTNGGNGSITLQNGAVVNGTDFLAGGATFSTPNVNSTGTILVTGAGTKYQMLTPGVSDGYFGSTIGTGNVTVTAGASVTAFRAFENDHGTFTVSNGGSVVLNPLASPNPGTSASIARFQGSGATGANITMNIDGGSFIANNNTTGADVFANASRLLWGLGLNTTTNMTISNGGLLQGGIISYGGADNTATATGTSNSTLTVTGANSKLIATDSFGLGGTVRFSNNLLGDSTMNVLAGGVVSAPIIATNGSDRPTGFTTASTTTVNVSGTGSTLLARPTGATGFLALAAGDNTQSVTTVSGGGLIDATTVRVAASNGTTATLNVNAGGTVTTDYLSTNDAFFSGQTVTDSVATVNVNAGTINVGSAYIELGVADVGLTNTATLNITNGGKVNSHDIITSESVTTVSTINVAGAGSQMNITQFLQTGGFGSGTAGSGRTVLNINSGGVVNTGYVVASLNTSTASAFDAIGTQINVDGVGSRLNVIGDTIGGGEAGDQPLSGNIQLASGLNNRASINVTNGGTVNVEQTVGTPDRSGALYMSGVNRTVSSVTVDGSGSTFLAGTLVTMSETTSDVAITNASSTLNVRNGGLFDVQGNIEMAAGDPGNTAVINLGGSGAADASSRIAAQTVFVGGSGATATPTTGGTATVNINNGVFDVVQTLVYAGSSVNITKGELNSARIAARGGNITIAAASPVGTARLVGDVYEASNGAVIDIGKNGGISFVNTASGDTTATEVAAIKALIVAGRTGGVNSIKSSAVTSTTGPISIGYAIRPAGGVASFLGYTFAPTDVAVDFRVTLKGDASLDGIVNFDDLVPLAQAYNSSGREWYNGDSDYDGDVDFDDLVSLAQNYNGTYSLEELANLGGPGFVSDWALAQSLAPEPATLGLMVAAVGLIGRRRR